MKLNTAKSCILGSKKVQSSSPGQEDFVAWQLSFKLYTCDAWARVHVRAACPKNMLQSMFFQARSLDLYSELLCQI